MTHKEQEILKMLSKWLTDVLFVVMLILLVVVSINRMGFISETESHECEPAHKHRG